ncbi:MAG TPA: hypothetical protein VFM27_20000 [Acidimicrobiales bacterium]|nr:hypothetical protein [Acidimicrobiales bacterium]
MARTADSWRFRARAERLSWTTKAREQLALITAVGADAGFWAEHLKRLSGRFDEDIRLMWTCSPELGVPRGPFTVWSRKPSDALEEVDVTILGGASPVLWWGGVEAACVEVTCEPLSGNRPVGLLLFRNGGEPRHVVSAGAVDPGGANVVTIRVRTPGATFARLVDGFNPSVLIDPLRTVVNDDSWQPIEVVGLPVDQPWNGTIYDSSPQGLVGAEVAPHDAAVDRLRRGGPRVGWWPITETARTAPWWEAPDSGRLVKEVRDQLLSEILPLYDGVAGEQEQAALTDLRTVDGPSQGGNTSTLATTADVGPWAKLVLPALSDPFLNLACGFGTAYPVEGRDTPPVAGHDFLVTATYSQVPFPMDSEEVAAYAPAAALHLAVPDPAGLAAERRGLVAPPVPDATWRESIRLRWQRVEPTASMPPITEAALAIYETWGGGDASSLLPERDAGGPRPFLIGAEAPEGQPGNDRIALVHGEAEIPNGSGGRDVGYAVAVSDVFGIWSRWQDVRWRGDEPLPLPPRIVAVSLSTTYAGSTACPATLATEIAVEWQERTPTYVDVVALFFPMATATTAPPAGLSPDLSLPAGCFRRDLALGFVGDSPIPSGCTVTPLNPAGDAAMAPGPGQGNGGRRYRLRANVPTLDYASVGRWGVQLFTRRELVVGPTLTAWGPPATHPALASAASPVPVLPLPPPAPPGVPLGSTLDADGRSHVRVHWSLPSGDVRTCIVWEASETALRQRVGLPPRAPDTDPPGVRLAELWNRYDAMTPTARRATFRRLAELPRTARQHDVALPKGSTDIHLFVVTTMTGSGVESPWPGGATPHEHLQAVIAPRLLQPGPPTVAPDFDEAGTVTIQLRSTGAIPVDRVRLYRTRSEGAARKVETMGPAFADVGAVVVSGLTDPVLRTPVYEAVWTGLVPGHWDPWLIRAVAVPPHTLPVQGVRGLPSPASDVVSLLVPPAHPPTLEPLLAEVWGADHRGVLVHTATTAPPRTSAVGTHTLSANAGAQVLAPVGIEALDETALTSPPAAASGSVVLERGVRSNGRSPLALWFTRLVAGDAVTVAIRIADPFGRVSEHTITVPGWVPPPPVNIRITDVFAVAGRGVGMTFETDASDEMVLEVNAAQRLAQPFPPPRRLSVRGLVGDVPNRPPLFPGRPGIQVARSGGEYSAFVPLTSPVAIEVAIEAPDGSRVTDTASG